MKEHDIILGYLQTEKGTDQLGKSKYFFRVNSAANKVQIKKSIEALYNVHVVKVNTMTVPGKLKTVRRIPGRTSPWKKAVVTVKQGETIEVS